MYQSLYQGFAQLHYQIAESFDVLSTRNLVSEIEFSVMELKSQLTDEFDKLNFSRDICEI